MKKLLAWLKKETVFTVSLAAALLSFLLAAPGMHNIEGINTTTLLMLFALMTVVAGLRLAGVFDWLGRALAKRVTTLRALAMVLVAVCFVLAQAATNDVALITLVPFTLMLMAGEDEKHVILTVVLETIAANLGSMVTPIGNPQNLYLYSSGLMGALDFLILTGPYALVSLVLMLALCLLIPASPVRAGSGETVVIPRQKAVLYAVLGVAALLGVANVLPAWAAALIVLLGTLALDRPVLRMVDFTLLGTFVCFFVFVSSIKACAPLRTWLEGLMAASPFLVSLASSQIISNVPACLLLSPFTDNAAAVMLGVDLGGLGTLVASLASLISFRLYGQSATAQKGRFFGVFTVLNVAFLAVMLVMAKLLGAW